MGLFIERDSFAEADYARFSDQLRANLGALERLLKRPGFGVGPVSLGAELEVSLIDAQARPLPINLAVLAETVDPRVTVELNRFNLECNLRHGPLAGRPFASLRGEFEDSLGELRRAAAAHAGRVAVIGILPTLREEDLQSGAMTDTPRFRALSAGLLRLRHEPFRLQIDGADPLEVTTNDVTFEGANTSLQIHLRIDPEAFARTFNAVQLATLPALAVSGNSPTFLGHRLWDETRIALFKQAVDDRGSRGRQKGRQARVSFGTGWVREGALELFNANVELHEPLLPVLSGEDPLAVADAGGVPQLEEMRLHQGTVWRWNRAIYDPVGGGHLRIEMRALPAGPTVTDMLANTAFLVGLALGMAEEADGWIRGFPFEQANHAFYRAAQRGLEAEIIWPERPGDAPRPVRARDLVLELLPLAQRGLVSAGVDADEVEPLLDVIEARARSGRTGAVWQREALARLDRHGRDAALAEMLEAYIRHAELGEPVHLWPAVDA